jgi:excisionase family DNA binding protein
MKQDLTVEEVATRLGASEDTVRKYLRTGELTGYMPGGRRLGWRIKPESLTAFIEAKTPTPKEPPSQLEIDWEGEQGKALRKYVEVLMTLDNLNWFTAQDILTDMRTTCKLPAFRLTTQSDKRKEEEEATANKQTSGT